MEMAKVTSKGQITIPVSIRRRLNIKEGDKLLFIDSPDGVVMVNPDMLQGGQTSNVGLSESAEGYFSEGSEVMADDHVVKQPVSSQNHADTVSQISKEQAPDTPTQESAESVPETVDDKTVITEDSDGQPDAAAVDTPAKQGSEVKGIDIAALLDEIRSIGSKI